MLHHPTIDKLQHLRFNGMLKALQEQQGLPQCDVVKLFSTTQLRGIL